MLKRGVKRNAKKKGSPLFIYIFACITLLWGLLFVVTLVASMRVSVRTVQDRVDNTLQSLGKSLSESEMVYRSIESGACPESLMKYLDNLVANTDDIDFITIADENAVRLYHVKHEWIGTKASEIDDENGIPTQFYFQDTVGSLGEQRRVYVPVTDGDGKTVGFILAGTTMTILNEFRKSIAITYIRLAVDLLLLSVVVAGVISIFIRKKLLGFAPQELLRSYLTHNEVINHLDEGVVFVNSQGTIQLVNKQTEHMLGVSGELLEGQKIDDIIWAYSGESLLDAEGQNVQTTRPNILSCALSSSSGKGSKNSGTVLILRDKSEAIRNAEQLSGSRNIISALRANSHEFMNKLQVLSGLLQMEEYDEAQNYINSVADVHTNSVGPLLKCIQNSGVAALLLAKTNNMRELDIKMTLLPDSFLPEKSKFLQTDDLITVIGNLLENAIEAVNARCDVGPRNIDISIIESDMSLVIIVTDTGVGIPKETVNQIYKFGYSTKAPTGRGIGMNLVRDTVKKYGGSIEVDSEEDVGTTFTVFFKD